MKKSPVYKLQNVLRANSCRTLPNFPVRRVCHRLLDRSAAGAVGFGGARHVDDGLGLSGNSARSMAARTKEPFRATKNGSGVSVCC